MDSRVGQRNFRTNAGEKKTRNLSGKPIQIKTNQIIRKNSDSGLEKIEQNLTKMKKSNEEIL
jgi:hypothetical protein